MEPFISITITVTIKKVSRTLSGLLLHLWCMAGCWFMQCCSPSPLSCHSTDNHEKICCCPVNRQHLSQLTSSKIVSLTMIYPSSPWIYLPALQCESFYCDVFVQCLPWNLVKNILTVTTNGLTCKSFPTTPTTCHPCCPLAIAAADLLTHPALLVHSFSCFYLISSIESHQKISHLLMYDIQVNVFI